MRRLLLLAVCLLALAPGAAARAQEPPPLTSDEQGSTYSSRPLRAVKVHAWPNHESRQVGVLRPHTYYGIREIVVVLEEQGTWSRVRYSGIGSRVGWVPNSALSAPKLTDSWVDVDRGRKILTAYKGGRKMLQVRVGVGARGSPTPGGRFFIRERLVPRNPKGIYGPLALGLSAYSKHRTDWPGGGQVGIHGTNMPGLIPGRISNGCIRLRNRDVRRLDRLVRPGTPVRVR